VAGIHLLYDFDETWKLSENDLNEVYGYKVQNISLPNAKIEVNWKIQILDSLGRFEKEEDVVPSIWTAGHADLDRIQLKGFHRILLLKHLSSRNDFTPVVGLNVLRDFWRAPERQSEYIEKAGQARKFLEFVFRDSPRHLQIADDKAELDGQPIRLIMDIVKFDGVYKSLLRRFEKEAYLEEDEFLKPNEKQFLKTYLYTRGKLKRELQEIPYPSWTLAILVYRKPLYLIADGMNAGLQVLMKYLAYEAGCTYFPSSIVLPHPRTISGEPMSYFNSADPRELKWDETLYVHDSLQDIRYKLTGGNSHFPSWWYLSFMVNNIIIPFAPKIHKQMFYGKDLESLYKKYVGRETTLLRLITKAYWQFIEPYYRKIEEICEKKETLRIDALERSDVLEALAKSDVRKVLETLVNLPEGKIAATCPEIGSWMNVPKSNRTMVNRAVKVLVNCKLVEPVKFMTSNVPAYRLSHKFKNLQLLLSLKKEKEQASPNNCLQD
jgi:hypothetical protein